MNPSDRLSMTLLSSRILSVCITLMMAFALLPATQPQPVEAQEFDEHTIIKRECPPGFDLGTGNAQNAFDNCPTLHPGISFTLNSQDPAYQGVVRTTDVGGTTGWSDIPAGSAYSIVESLPAGYGDPWVFCRIYEQLDDSGNSVEFYFQAPGGVMDVGLTDPSLIALRDATCYWFNVPPAATEPAEPTPTATTEPAETTTTITIQKRQCPFRYPYAAVSLAELQASCATPLRNISFHINDDPATQRSADTNGLLVFDNVPLGSVSIREEAYASFDTARVFCQSHPVSDENVVFDPSNEVPFTTEAADSFVVNVEASAGNRIDCLWFNAHITEEDLGSLIITKYVCPEPDDATYASLAELTRSCPEPQAEAYFELVQPGSISGGETDSNGVRPFQNYSPGAYDLRETEPAGYATARVFCYEHPSSEPVAIPDSFQEYTVTNKNQISIELKAGFDLDCAWINVPVEANIGWVIVHKYYCLASTNPASVSRETLLQVCDRSLVGIPFDLHSEDGTYQSSKTVAQNGDATWYDVPPGNLTLTETVPTGYQVARVFCGSTPTEGGAPPPLEELTYGSGLAFTVTAGSTFVCEFYNTHIVQAANGFVDVYKFICPPEFDNAAATTRDEFAQACSGRPTGVLFDIAGPDGFTRSAVTDFGTAYFQEQAPAGTLTITETPATDQTVVRVFCGEAPYIGIGAIPDEWTDYAAAAQIQFDLTQGYQLVCEWYNVSTGTSSFPATPVASEIGDAIVRKYACPEGYDASINTFEAYQQACSEPQAGVMFEFAAESGTASGSGPTNEEGISGFGGYPAGQVTMKETPPAGYRLARIYCQSYPQGTQNPDPANYQEQPFDASNLIELELQGGYQIDCIWFNELVPEEGTGTIIVHKYGCPEAYDDLNGNLASLQSGCSTPLESVHFFAFYGGGSGGKGTLTDASGAATIDELPAGPISLRESYTTGYQPLRAFCHAYEGGQQNANIDLYDEYTIDSEGAIALELQAGYEIDCIWFNLPVNNYGWVTAYTHVCPGTVDIPSASRDDLAQSCSEPLSGAQYLLETSDEVLYQSQRTAGPDGIGHWDEAPALPLRLSHFPPPSYVIAKAYCGIAAQNEGTLPGSWDEQEFQNGVLFDLQGGQYYHCEFYLIPNPDYGTIVITKHLCGAVDVAGVPASDMFEFLSSECTDPGSGFNFTLQASGGDVPGEANLDGLVTWPDLAPGDVTVSEGQNGPYSSLGAYCTKNPDRTSDFEEYAEAGETSFDYAVTAGEILSCTWFDKTTEELTVLEIVKFACPAEITDPAASYEVLSGACTETQSGVQFSVNDELGYNSYKSTNSEGLVSWTSISPGGINIQEYPSPSEFPAAVFCSERPPDQLDYGPFQRVEYDADQEHILYTMNANRPVACHWFNFGSDTDYGTVNIIKYNCPESVLGPGQVNGDDLVTECTEPGSGYNFSLQTEEGEEVSQGTSGADGKLILLAETEGTYQIVEEQVEGYVTAAVLCQGQAPTTDPGALTLPEFSTLPFPLSPGSTLDCQWYNVPFVESPYEPGTIVIHKFDCPPGYPDDGVDLDGLVFGCQAPNSEEQFSVFQNDQPVGTAATDFSGTAVISNVPSGAIRISELPKEGFDPPRVFCTTYAPENGVPLPGYNEQTVENWGHPYELADSYVVECYWFNLPRSQGQSDESIQIIIHKFLCAEGYDPTGQAFETVSATCTAPEEGVDFRIQSGTPPSITGPTDVNGYVEFNGVPPEFLSIDEVPRQGYQTVAVYCSAYYTSPGSYNALPAPNGQFAYYLAPGYKLECNWFNAPVEQVSNVTVIKYLCPAGYDYAGKLQSDLKASCTERIEGIPFTLSAGPDYSQTSSTDQNGEILWEDVPAVPLTVEEEPAGPRLVRVFCGETPIGDPESPPSQWDDYSPTSGSVFGPHVSPGHHLYCEVYNEPGEQNPPQVWIQKYNCPEEADHRWTYQQLLPACLTPAEGVRFEYKREGGQFLEIDTDALGRAQLTGLEPDTWIITERFPDGYDGVAVFCQFITPQHAGAYQRAQVYNGEIALELDYDYVVTCVWFDFLEGHAPPAATPPADGHQPLEPTSPGGGGTGGGGTSGGGVPSTGGAGQGTTGGGQTLPPVDPDAPATLIITKYTCEPLYDVHREDSDPAVDCPTLTDDIAFTLTNEDETDPVDLQGVTGEDEEGTVAFRDLSPGPYLLTEELPAGTRSAFIYTCESDRRDFPLENPFTPFAYAGPDGRIGVTLEPGETLECDWYDVPQEQAGGQVTIVKYACPGASVIVAQCQPFPDGATIGLVPVGDEDGEVIELVTGEDGTATAAVEGTYTLRELPDTACLVDSDAFDAEGNLVVNDGDEVEVRVYNCGLETDEGG